MSGIQWFRAVRCAQFLLAGTLLLLGMSRPAAAQQDAVDNETQCWWDPGGNTVCGDAYLSMTIFYSASGAEIITDVSTEIAYEYAWEGLYVYAESDLYLNDTWLGAAWDG